MATNVWRHTTNKGKICYNRKKRFFNEAALARISKSLIASETGDTSPSLMRIIQRITEWMLERLLALINMEEYAGELNDFLRNTIEKLLIIATNKFWSDEKTQKFWQERRQNFYGGSK